mmetsp:Transcript_68802/g.128386  ORF Transcript_68802/g.128386 Transcript_68802/m.128386 type:complete len:448 (+) Transcript_68802:75-1418(+)
MSLQRLLAFVAAGLISCADAKHWAVLVAGSNTFMNYRHQADVCHAYKTLIAKGMSPSRIITMAYDDIAHDKRNPFPGKLYNKPDPKGPGVDVYAGCKIDYKGEDVNVKNFLKVLTGDTSAKGPVLKSGSRDHVFVNFVDHGAPGLVAFPSTELHKSQLDDAFTTMHKKKMYNKLVFYLEACESGSMFKGLTTPGIFGVSASNPTESSWGTYCPGMSNSDATADMVNGKHIGSCLGDLFSVNWMEDSDVEDATKETLDQQFKIVMKKTNKSHVMEWGDKTFVKDTIGEYIGNQFGAPLEAKSEMGFDVNAVSVDSRRVDMVSASVGCKLAEWPEDCEATQKALRQEQHLAVLAHRRLVNKALAHTELSENFMWTLKEEPENPTCELAAHAALRESCASSFNANSGFALGMHQVIVNLCSYSAKGNLNLDVPALAATVCHEEVAETLVV